MSKAPETIYIDRDGAIGRWYKQLEKDVDIAYVRGDIAYGYASQVEKLRNDLRLLEHVGIEHEARIERLKKVLSHISRNASVMTTHAIETMASKEIGGVTE